MIVHSIARVTHVSRNGRPCLSCSLVYCAYLRFEFLCSFFEMEAEEGQRAEAAPGTTEAKPTLPYHLLRISPQKDLLLLVSGSSFSIFNLRLAAITYGRPLIFANHARLTSLIAERASSCDIKERRTISTQI